MPSSVNSLQLYALPWPFLRYSVGLVLHCPRASVTRVIESWDHRIYWVGSHPWFPSLEYVRHLETQNFQLKIFCAWIWSIEHSYLMRRAGKSCNKDTKCFMKLYGNLYPKLCVIDMGNQALMHFRMPTGSRGGYLTQATCRQLLLSDRSHSTDTGRSFLRQRAWEGIPLK